MRYEISLSPEALRDLRRLEARDRAAVLEVRVHAILFNPMVEEWLKEEGKRS